jgi:hypothetical protein
MCASPSHANPAGILNQSLESVAPLPPFVSAITAIQRLRTIRLTPAHEAVGQLSVWQESSRILSLYRRYFPQQFARSTANTHIPIRQNEPGYSDRELEFFNLIDQHLFPLPEMMFDMDRLPSIPLYPQGIDWEDERDNMRLSLHAAMALVSDEETMLWEAWLPKHLRPLPGRRDWDRLTQLCRASKGLSARFLLLLEFVALDTGNVWLDTNWECCWEEYAWEEVAMEYLKKEWRKAQRIFGQLNPLLDQMDKHPRYWLKQLVTLWNSALKVPEVAR